MILEMPWWGVSNQTWNTRHACIFKCHVFKIYSFNCMNKWCVSLFPMGFHIFIQAHRKRCPWFRIKINKVLLKGKPFTLLDRKNLWDFSYIIYKTLILTPPITWQTSELLSISFPVHLFMSRSTYAIVV